jgi:hypothetical protein
MVCLGTPHTGWKMVSHVRKRGQKIGDCCNAGDGGEAGRTMHQCAMRRLLNKTHVDMPCWSLVGGVTARRTQLRHMVSDLCSQKKQGMSPEIR